MPPRAQSARFIVLFLTAQWSGGCGDGAAPVPDSAAAPDSSVADAAPDAALDADTGAADAAAVDAVVDAGPAWTGPERLAETGLWADPDARVLADGVLILSPRWPLWSDGSEKTRYLLLPPGTTIDTRDPDAWIFPIGTRAWKDFRRDGVLVETRFVEKTGEGDDGWRYVAYVWDADEREAVATPEGLPDALGTPHDVPSERDCRNCHRGGGDFLLGVSAIQLGGASGHLAILAADGWLSTAPPSPTELEPPGPAEVGDALGYLHANCGSCHSDRHPLSFMRGLRLALPVGVATPEETPAYRTAIGTPAAHAILGTTMNVIPGMPSRSQLYVRMGPVDPLLRMPQVGTELPDDDGRTTIETWISGLSRP